MADKPPTVAAPADKEDTSVSGAMKNLSLESDIPATKNRREVTEKQNTELSTERNPARPPGPDTLSYDAQRMIGHGSFGAVFLAKVSGTNDMVAIKKVLQDRRFKNRELQIMRQLARQPHPYVVQLRHYFVTKGSKADDVYLNLVLEYIPETIYSVAKSYMKAKEPFPMLLAKIYMYQLGRALGHIHGVGICHRDIKPQNLLVDPTRCVLKLCDFGSAKALVYGEPNVAYICSRYYRAPELIFGSTVYSTAIDVWSHGCVLAELLLGYPMFPGASGVDQLVEVIKVLGTPTKEELKAMNPNYQEFKFPLLRANPLVNIFSPSTPPAAIDLLNKLWAYVPTDRPKAIETCMHPFFDAIRAPGATMMDGVTPIPLLMFQFTTEEVALSEGVAAKLIPAHRADEVKENPNPCLSMSPGPLSELQSVAEN